LSAPQGNGQRQLANNGFSLELSCQLFHYGRHGETRATPFGQQIDHNNARNVVSKTVKEGDFQVYQAICQENAIALK
jgi:hypothetical protein